MPTHVSSNSNNTTTVEPPMVQTSHTMPPINQTTPSNYHIDQYPGINNNYMLMQTPIFVQGSYISPPSQMNSNNSNQFSAPVPCPAVPNRIPNLLPLQTTSTRQLFTEKSQPMLHPPVLYSDMPHTLSYVENDNASNVHGQYLMQSPQTVRPNLAPVIKQETEYSHLAAYNSDEQPRNSTNQATHKTMTEIYAEGQTESFQQQQQNDSDHKMLDILNNIQPPISHHSQQDVEEASVPLLHLPSSNDTVTTPTQTVFTAAHIQGQKGK